MLLQLALEFAILEEDHLDLLVTTKYQGSHPTSAKSGILGLFGELGDGEAVAGL